MKKLIALTVVALFTLATVATALADNTNNNNGPPGNNNGPPPGCTGNEPPNPGHNGCGN